MNKIYERIAELMFETIELKKTYTPEQQRLKKRTMRRGALYPEVPFHRVPEFLHPLSKVTSKDWQRIKHRVDSKGRIIPAGSIAGVEKYLK